MPTRHSRLFLSPLFLVNGNGRRTELGIRSCPSRRHGGNLIVVSVHRRQTRRLAIHRLLLTVLRAENQTWIWCLMARIGRTRQIRNVIGPSLRSVGTSRRRHDSRAPIPGDPVRYPPHRPMRRRTAMEATAREGPYERGILRSSPARYGGGESPLAPDGTGLVVVHFSVGARTHWHVHLRDTPCRERLRPSDVAGREGPDASPAGRPQRRCHTDQGRCR
jgi:hypothetical protein